MIIIYNLFCKYVKNFFIFILIYILLYIIFKAFFRDAFMYLYRILDKRNDCKWKGGNLFFSLHLSSSVKNVELFLFYLFFDYNFTTFFAEENIELLLLRYAFDIINQFILRSVIHALIHVTRMRCFLRIDFLFNEIRKTIQFFSIF